MFDWNLVSVEVEFVNQVLGGIPKHPKLIQDWINSKIPPVEAAAHEAKHPGETLEALAERTKAEVAQAEDKTWTTFKSDEQGPYQEGRQWKAHVKDHATILQLTEKRGLKTFMQECLFVEPRKIRMVTSDGEILEVQGIIESAAQVMTARGPRSVLRRQDYIDKPRVAFAVRMLKRKKNTGDLTVDELKDLFEYGQFRGFGCRRGDGYGNYKLVKFETL